MSIKDYVSAKICADYQVEQLLEVLQELARHPATKVRMTR